jgi:hypothetical protein
LLTIGSEFSHFFCIRKAIFIRMRFLISLILTSLFFLASHDSDAAGKCGFDIGQNTESGIIAKDLTGSTPYADAGSIVFTQVSLRTPSFKLRTVQGIYPDYIPLPFSACEVLSVADCPTKSFSHCVPIGLKLLFPKHYFW